MPVEGVELLWVLHEEIRDGRVVATVLDIDPCSILIV
jgi:hypothetical protein